MFVLSSGHLILDRWIFRRQEMGSGTRLTDLWKRAGDLVRDMGALFRERGLDYSDEEIGGRGSIHLYVAARRPD